MVLMLFTTVVGAVEFYNTAGARVGNFNKVSCGAGVTCTQSSGKLSMVSSPTVSVGTLSISAAEGADSTLFMLADEGDDSGDSWRLMSAASGNAFTLSNNTSGSQVAKFTISTAGAVTMVGDLTGDGGDQLVGFLQNQVASTTTTITAAQCGSTFISNSADVMALPEASTVLGCQLTFICGTADDFDINPDDADVIGPAINSVAGGTGAAITPSAGDAIRCTDIGSSLTIEAVGAALWNPVGVGNGAWTDVN